MRLIDADALIREIKNSAFPQDSFYPRHYRKLIEELMEAPTVDAVPVIRCKDCKELFTGSDGKTYCWVHECTFRDLEDYCSLAERGTNEAD